MDLFSKKPSFLRFYILKRNIQLIDRFEIFLNNYIQFINEFFDIPKNDIIINFNKNYIKELEYGIGNIINTEKNLGNTEILRKQFLIKLSNFNKIQIINDYLNMFDYIKNNFIPYINIDNEKIYTHIDYRKNFIPRLNNCINSSYKMRLQLIELSERPINYYEYSFVRTLFNKKIVLIKGITKIHKSLIHRDLKSDIFNIHKISTDNGQELFWKLNLLINEFELIRKEILFYFERDSIIIEHGLFSKLNTNIARKTDFEKTKLQKKLHTNLHNTKTIIN